MAHRAAYAAELGKHLAGSNVVHGERHIERGVVLHAHGDDGVVEDGERRQRLAERLLHVAGDGRQSKPSAGQRLGVSRFSGAALATSADARAYAGTRARWGAIQWLDENDMPIRRASAASIGKENVMPESMPLTPSCEPKNGAATDCDRHHGTIVPAMRRLARTSGRAAVACGLAHTTCM